VAVIIILLLLEGVPRAIADAACVAALCALVIVESAVPSLLVLVARLFWQPARALSPLLVFLRSGLGFLLGVGAVFGFLVFVHLTDFSFGLRSRHELYYTLTPPLLGSSLGTLAGTLIRHKPRGPALRPALMLGGSRYDAA
jgi:hypothetical protein